MKKIIKFIKITFIIILSIFIIGVIVLFQIYEKNSTKPVYFDILISEIFFRDKNGSPWDKVTVSEKRPIEWILNEKEFEKLDSVHIGFKNISKEKMYYMTWGRPLSRIRENYIIYRDGKTDTISFGGFGCGTGIYLTPLKNKEITKSKLLNPLFYNHLNGYDLNLENKKFPEKFKEIYGDSVAISFEQATFSLPWSKYPPQMIESNQIVISTDKIIRNWENGIYLKLPKREETLEEYFGLKKIKSH